MKIARELLKMSDEDHMKMLNAILLLISHIYAGGGGGGNKIKASLGGWQNVLLLLFGVMLSTRFFFTIYGSS